MKKTIAKLVLKRETLRTLDRMQIDQIRGAGGAAALADTGNATGCPALIDTGNKDGCPGLAFMGKP